MIILDGQSLSLDDLVFIARHHEKVSIAKESIQKIIEASSLVEELIKKEKPIYGINTGFGHLANVKIENDKLDELQVNLLKSHACSMGDPLSIEVVRAMLALRINALIKGYSGTRLETIELMVTLLNENIIPVIFEQGSLGASGDLALLAHMGLPLLGLGEVYYKQERMDAKIALDKAHIKP
jgi:histidine ammonia-lyase